MDDLAQSITVIACCFRTVSIHGSPPRSTSSARACLSVGINPDQRLNQGDAGKVGKCLYSACQIVHSNPNPFDFPHAHIIIVPVVKSSGFGVRVPGHLLRDLDAGRRSSDSQ
jgi:hypothetical protein